ncbi:hypothetical protein [Methylobacterium sp. yr596]|uniref:hypothetical protein n=1 Tax=Methylobacterium sp. yr596 TaxID=1761800 RepID=UPI001FCD1A85|nr:hypothetical protein [Methylobacterium sp. yr596]
MLATDVLEVYPTSPSTFPVGYAIHHALPTAANTFKAVVNVPVLSVATTYSIPVAVYSVNR